MVNGRLAGALSAGPAQQAVGAACRASDIGSDWRSPGALSAESGIDFSVSERE